MRYKKIENLLPADLLEQIQAYVDGAFVYIPRKSGQKRAWGAATSTREEISHRNEQIYKAHLAGCSTHRLATEYFLSLKSIQRIIREQKNMPKILMSPYSKYEL